MLALSGRAISMDGFAPEVGRRIVRLRAGKPPESPFDAALVRSGSELIQAIDDRFNCAVSMGAIPVELGPRLPALVQLDDEFSYLGDGDIVAIEPKSNHLRVLYRRASQHNWFLVTERCNHYCLMCSQPPRKIDDRWIIDEIAAAIPLLDPATKSIGLTGGEPLLEWKALIQLLARFGETLPGTELHVLTNGRAFADSQIVTAWAGLKNPRLCAGIPVYSSVDFIHDHVVQAKGAFDETVLGILRLKDKGQRVEVRLVLHKLTVDRLVETADWFAHNLPFVDHIALMGLEDTGFAIANREQIWIDPQDYRQSLTAAVGILDRAGLNVSVYNLPLCLVDREIWKFAVQSISDWKNDYLPECGGCAVQDRCAGFFTTGRPKRSAHIRAIQAA